MTGQYRIAIVGAGPAGFYAAEALMKSELPCEVDMYEQLPSPYGLVRYGVAPDHPLLKKPIQVYEKIAAEPAFRLLANVTVGRDIKVEELKELYDAVLYSFGAQSDRLMGIDGENLAGCHSATDFVGWYNGHPHFRHLQFDLSGRVAVIIGQGNVAADLVRMLLKEPDELAETDIAGHALEMLRSSNIQEVHVVGRRGPGQAKFGNKELREMGELGDVDIHVAADDLELNAATSEELAERANFAALKNVEMFRGFANSAKKADSAENTDNAKTVARKQLHFHFLCSPAKVHGDNKVTGIDLTINRLVGDAGKQCAIDTGGVKHIPCDLIFTSIGYLGTALPGLPFDAQRGVVPNVAGRVSDRPACYVAGWIKRGPSGTIGSNRACALDTVASMLEDLALASAKGMDAEAPMAILKARGVKVVNFDDWSVIDRAEQAAGERVGKPREKFSSVDEMLTLLES